MDLKVPVAKHNNGIKGDGKKPPRPYAGRSQKVINHEY
jgi:hypothetical protein